MPPSATVESKPRLLASVRDALRVRHYSRRKERAYVGWIRRYVLFHGKRHPADMGASEVSRFLSTLATESRVSASTQNQALAALLFLYRAVLGKDVPWLDDLVRAKRPIHLPVVISRGEVEAVLAELRGMPQLMAVLLYGAGLRLLECARLPGNTAPIPHRSASFSSTMAVTWPRRFRDERLALRGRIAVMGRSVE